MDMAVKIIGVVIKMAVKIVGVVIKMAVEKICALIKMAVKSGGVVIKIVVKKISVLIKMAVKTVKISRLVIKMDWAVQLHQGTTSKQTGTSASVTLCRYLTRAICLIRRRALVGNHVPRTPGN
jgi:hypothetical protein